MSSQISGGTRDVRLLHQAAKLSKFHKPMRLAGVISRAIRRCQPRLVHELRPPQSAAHALPLDLCGVAAHLGAETILS